MGPRCQVKFFYTSILNLQAKWHTQRCQDSSKSLSKDLGVGGSQLLWWSSHSLVYGITHLTKTNHNTFHGHHFLKWPMPCVLCFFLNLNKFTSLTEFWQWDIKSLSFIRHWSQALWVLGGLKSQERGDEGQEEKEVRKKCAEESPW